MITYVYKTNGSFIYYITTNKVYGQHRFSNIIRETTGQQTIFLLAKPKDIY